ncbi:uncharacterized protein LOC131857980 [Cryptomeria japonica]|uniref:uncharacterized protein LOC131857980 n=1 Tax=Cryptomeria japonica TaxID=3369 RepID=UPI0027D9F537|nr:uncharacterized protein LOC131857980 [Cryptomeria japonica]XP_059066793.1 uncharacterized protein LOC131857980 [Cryptomeria japonica]
MLKPKRLPCVQDSKQREPKHKGTSSCSSSAVHLQGKAAIQQHQLFIRVFPPACKRSLLRAGMGADINCYKPHTLSDSLYQKLLPRVSLNWGRMLCRSLQGCLQGKDSARKETEHKNVKQKYVWRMKLSSCWT